MVFGTTMCYVYFMLRNESLESPSSVEYDIQFGSQGVRIMDPPPQTECIVSGALGLVLRMSRITGVAPLKFKKTPDGWSIRVSPVASCYGKVLGIILWTLAAITIVMDMCVHPEMSIRISTLSTRVVWIVDVIIVGLVVCSATFTGLHRMRCLIVYIVQLQKINLKLNIQHQEPSNEKIRILIIITLMTLPFIALSISYSVFIHYAATQNKNTLTSSLYIFNNMLIMTVEVIILQFSQVATYVLSSLQRLNQCLKSMLQEILNSKLPCAGDSKHRVMLTSKNLLNVQSRNSYKPINSIINTTIVHEGPTATFPATVRHLAFFYCSVCDVVRQVNDSYGVVLVTLLLSLLLHLVITPYHAITHILDTTDLGRRSPLLQINWTIIHFSNLLMIVEPCHRTHEEMALTKHLISQMTRFAPLENAALLFELQVFYRHLMLNTVTYSPLKMFSLNRTLIVTLLGSITTYLVVIVQF